MLLSSPNSVALLGAFGGLASWLYLHRHTVRADRALALHLVLWTVLYTTLRLYVPSWAGHALYETLSFGATYLLALVFTTTVYRLSPWHPLAGYPGPLLCRISSLWLVAVSSTGKRHLIVDRLHAKYGPFVRVGPNMLSVNSTSAISLYSSMEKGESYRFPGDDGVVSIFMKQDSREEHRERRRIWGGLFTPNGVAELQGALEKRTWDFMRCISHRQEKRGGSVDVAEAFYHWAFDLAGDVIFGSSSEFELMANGDDHGLVDAGKLSTIAMDTFGHAPWLLQILYRLPATDSMHQHVKLASRMTRNRVNSNASAASKDLLSYLIESGIPMRDIERDAAIAILAAAENTAITLAITCFYLVESPQYLRKLREELECAFPDPLGALSPASLANIAFLDCVLYEALRLGVFFFLPRIIPPGGTVLDGRFVPAGTTVALAGYSQQRSADNFFPEPAGFLPERWLPDGLGPYTKTNKAALASFSYGQHMCLGKTLALQQMRHVLARLVLTYDMAFPPGFDLAAFRAGIVAQGTMLFQRPLLFEFTRRPDVEFDVE
ncbi:cytochrome P450 [Trametes maxima]|nr:cytochrome P450 [Trametes maxima]